MAWHVALLLEAIAGGVFFAVVFAELLSFNQTA